MSVSEVYGTIITREHVTQKMIDDILCSAFEGGINYWAANAFPENNVWPDGTSCASECLSRGVNICIEDLEEDDELGNRQLYFMNLQMFIDGLSKTVADKGVTLESFYEDHDAFDADMVIQNALFGRIIYG